MLSVLDRIGLPITLLLWGALLPMVLVSCGGAERSGEVERLDEVDWPKETLAYYNPFDLTNAPGCPNIPGVFFFKDGSACVTFLPAMGNHRELLGNSSFRYSVPVAVDDRGRRLFEASLNSSERCENNPKVAYLRTTLSNTFEVDVVLGTATVTHPEAIEILTDGLVCQCRVSPRV